MMVIVAAMPGLRSQELVLLLILHFDADEEGAAGLDVRGSTKTTLPGNVRGLPPPANATVTRGVAVAEVAGPVLDGGDEAFDPEAVDADDVHHRIARLHPFAGMAMDPVTPARLRRADLVAADALLRRRRPRPWRRRLPGAAMRISNSAFSIAKVASVYFISFSRSTSAGTLPGTLRLASALT